MEPHGHIQGGPAIIAPTPTSIAGSLENSRGRGRGRGRNRGRRRGTGAGRGHSINAQASFPSTTEVDSRNAIQRRRSRWRQPLNNAPVLHQAVSNDGSNTQIPPVPPQGVTHTRPSPASEPNSDSGTAGQYRRGRRTQLATQASQGHQPGIEELSASRREAPSQDRISGRGRRNNSRTTRSARRAASIANPELPVMDLETGNVELALRREAHDTKSGQSSSAASEPGETQTTSSSFATSDVTELASSLASMMTRGQMECVVCLDRIRRDRATWTCTTCFTIVHLGCARKWAKQTTSAQENTHSRNTEFPCPSCRSPTGNTNKLHYVCYCGARRNPQLVPGLIPGSCGDPCLKKRGQEGSKCKHRCAEICHPGPCPPCIAMSTPVKCHCGKKEVQMKCGDPIPVDGVACGARCGRKLSGCEHECERTCHSGPCGDCVVPVNVSCGCGAATTALPCSVTTLGYVCGAVCGKELECGNHVCARLCHEGDCEPCPESPSLISHCACGKRLLTEEEKAFRLMCTDPIPSCGMTCDKKLSCLAQHNCEKICGHSGECTKCNVQVSAECRCGSSLRTVICGSEEAVLRTALVCDKRCNERLSCRKHRCREICCRFRRRKGFRSSGAVSSAYIWADAEGTRESHQCQEQCGQILSCKLHSCDLQCGHRNECPPCGLLLREPVSCACGAESTPVPVRCGTPAPSCRKPCTRPRPCGHPCSEPTCHQGDCPPCVELVQIDCVGEHGALRFIACHIGATGIKCHRSCGRSLKCNVHACRKGCHSVENEACEESSPQGCNQLCGLPRSCGHGCEQKCHAGRLCPNIPCAVPIVVTCPCGMQKQEAPCLRGGQNLPLGSGGIIRLTCNEDCNSQRRLRAFATAVGKMGTSEELNERSIVSSSDSRVEKPASYSGFLLHFAENETAALEYFEKEIGAIVLGKVKKATFKGIPRLHRLVVHNLAELYNLDSESSGREPDRQIIVRHRGPGIKPMFPRPLLSEAFFAKKRKDSRLQRDPLSKSLVIHVTSLANIHGSADITTRVEQELKMHTGFYVVVRQEVMKNNLRGVMVKFSTRERMEMAKKSLSIKPGITIETCGVATTTRATSAPALVPSSCAPWSSGESNDASASMENPSTMPVADVPDSWEDD